MSEERPKKQLPGWVEPLFVAAFMVTAWIEWGRGERFWTVFFVIAAVVFGVTGYVYRRK